MLLFVLADRSRDCVGGEPHQWCLPDFKLWQ